jgi:hypothetical protein
VWFEQKGRGHFCNPPFAYAPAWSPPLLQKTKQNKTKTTYPQHNMIYILFVHNSQLFKIATREGPHPLITFDHTHL